MSSSITDITKKSSQIIEIAELIIKELASRQKEFSLTLNQLKVSVGPDNPWSIFLSSLAYLSENEIIRVLDDGAIKLIKENVKSREDELDGILKEIKEEYDYVLKKLAE